MEEEPLFRPDSPVKPPPPRLILLLLLLLLLRRWVAVTAVVAMGESSLGKGERGLRIL
jgi:hypothetical protein